MDTVIALTLPTTSSDDLLMAYSKIFGGLSRYPRDFHIVLRKGAVPVIHPPHRDLLMLQPRLKEVLDNMKCFGIIIKRNEPMD